MPSSVSFLGIPGVQDGTEIGRGGFGVVYRATESELGRDVAVKVLTGELDERSRTRFERERKAMGALSSHPNIVTVFRSGISQNGAPYLVMEYLSGGSLAERIATSDLPSWEGTLSIGVQISGALETAHRHGVLHRDVKPGNIMIDSLNQAKLGDFGIARLSGGPETKSAVITASIAHAPPEVIAGVRPDERSDVYSLASTLYELASGTPAFQRSTDESMVPMFARIATEPVPDLRVSGVPGPLADALEKAMSKNPDERFGSAGELGRALNEAQRSLAVSPTPLAIEGEPHAATADSQPSTRKVSPDGSHVAPPAPGAPPALARAASPAGPTQSSRTAVYAAMGAAAVIVLAAIFALVRSGGDSNPPEAPQAGEAPVEIELGPATEPDPTPNESTTPTAAPAATPEPTAAPSATPAPTTVPTPTPEPPALAPLPPRPAFLGDLPELPATEPAYAEYKTVLDTNEAFLFNVPQEWVDELASSGEVLVSTDNNAALGDEVISGVLVSASQGVGFFDGELFLDALLLALADPANPCTELRRQPFVQGPFDGVVHVASCSSGAALVVSIVVSTPARDAVLLMTMQLTQERDFGALTQFLNSFFLLDSTQLPLPE